MSTNTWTPDAELNKQITQISTEELMSYIKIGKSAEIEKLIGQLNKKNISAITPLMKQDISFWQSHCLTFSNDDVIALIRFFTIAEEKHSQLFAGKDSSVIALNKFLKSRNEKLSKDDLTWIRKNSSNRYIPNGSV